MGIYIIKMRLSWDSLIFIMVIPILVRWHLYIETGPREPATHISKIKLESILSPVKAPKFCVLHWKLKSCQNANFVIISGTLGCHNDNLQCHQWQQSWHHDNSHFSVSAYQTFSCWLVPTKILLTPSHRANVNVAHCMPMITDDEVTLIPPNFYHGCLCQKVLVNLLAPGRFISNFTWATFQLILMIDG